MIRKHGLWLLAIIGGFGTVLVTGIWEKRSSIEPAGPPTAADIPTRETAMPATGNPNHSITDRGRSVGYPELPQIVPSSITRRDESSNEFYVFVLFEDRYPYEVREEAARILMQNTPLIGSAAILAAVLASAGGADCEFNTRMLRLAVESVPISDAVADDLTGLACGSPLSTERLEEIRQTLRSVMRDAVTDDGLGAKLAELYLSDEGPERRERLGLLDSPYLLAASILDSERNNRSEDVDAGLRQLVGTDHAFGALMYLAKASNMPIAKLGEAVASYASRQRNAHKELLASYLASADSIEYAVASYALAAVESTNASSLILLK